MKKLLILLMMVAFTATAQTEPQSWATYDSWDIPIVEFTVTEQGYNYSQQTGDPLLYPCNDQYYYYSVRYFSMLPVNVRIPHFRINLLNTESEVIYTDYALKLPRKRKALNKVLAEEYFVLTER